MNDWFQFKRFIVKQDRCAMKVGTDGVLLGAWAQGSRRILDIGTGTGLIALMMAQRFPDAVVDAVEIDGEAANQAKDNAVCSPFHTRVNVLRLLCKIMQRILKVNPMMLSSQILLISIIL